MPLIARASSPVVRDPYTLCFDDIKTKPGKYINRRGKILLVFSKNATFVQVPTSAVRTGYTRTGMLMLRPQRGGGFRATHVICDNRPDGVKKWMPYSGTITL